MAGGPKLAFAPFSTPFKGVLVVFCDDGLKIGAASRRTLGRAADLVTRAAAADGFKGKSGATLDLVTPADLKATRLVVVGIGKPSDLKPQDFVKFGGVAMGKVPASASEVTILAELPGGAMRPDQVADLALGARLRAYAFDRYKTKRKEGEEKPASVKVTIGVADPAAARKAWSPREAVADGVLLARDLVHEPANVLHPEEFARRAAGLRKSGVMVDVLDPRAMKKIGRASCRERV